MTSASDQNERAWYAVRTKPRHEKATARALDALGHEQFLPLRRTRKKWSDRMQTTELPLFPGYLFCKFCWNNRLPILTTPGVNSIISFGSKPSPVDPHEIAALQKVIASGMPVEPHPFLAVGARVRIHSGAMAGVEGILTSHRNNWRIVVSITLLQRSVGVEIDRASVIPLAATQ